MDVGRLSQTLSWMRSDERTHKIQAKLTNVQNALQNLTNSPGDQNFQTELTASLTELSSTLTLLSFGYDPSQLGRLIEVGGGPFFTSNLIDRIKTQINANPMSPATALEDVNKLVEQRQAFISRVKSTEDGIDSLIEYEGVLKPGEAALGFEIPRELFDNEFKDFINELRFIQRVVRVFAEVEIGSVPEIKLGSLSSTDPLIFLNAPPVLVASIAASVGWLLTQWKKFEEIRKIRADTAKIGEFTKDEMEQFFDRKISESLDKAVAERVDEMLSKSKLDAARRAELDSELAWAMKALFARVERGMRVEVSVNYLEFEDEQELSELQKEEQAILSRVDALSNELTFPQIEVEPILALPKMPDGDSAQKSSRASKASTS